MKPRQVHTSSRAVTRARPVTITLDLSANSLRVGDLTFGEQWLEFYAVLVEASSSDNVLVTADDLRALGRWAHKTPKSARAEVHRHVRDALHGFGDGRVIQSPPRGATRAWCLALPADRVVVTPDRRALHGWIARRRTRAMGDGLDVRRVGAIVRASIQFQRGRMEDAFGQLQPIGAPGSTSALDAWHALLLARVHVRYLDGNDQGSDEIRAMIDAWSRTGHSLGKAMTARLSAVVAYGHRTRDPGAWLKMLGRRAAALEHSGDLASLASVVNVMGLLVQRQQGRALSPDASVEAFRSARAHFERAAGLFGLAGDAWSLQAALFNAARALRQELAALGLEATDEVFALLDLGLEVCDGFRVGDDSIQSEALGARWAWEAGRDDVAARYGARIDERAPNIDATFERAVVLRHLGHRAIVNGDVKAAQGLLRSAQEMFTQADDAAAIREVDAELACILAGRATEVVRGVHAS
ncbi:MAG: hypothetical protein ACHREM_10755 [Polyangiales bacterium]